MCGQIIRIKPPIRFVGFLVWGILVLLAGCSESPTELESAKSQRPGFNGQVSGAVSGEISGAGSMIYLAARDMGNRKRPGYYFISNFISGTMKKNGLKVYFRVPLGIKPGTYNLATPDPLAGEQDFEAWLEYTGEGKKVYYNANIEGTVTLEMFPSKPKELLGAPVKGSFQFETENFNAERVVVKGTFNFLAGNSAA